MLRGIPKNSYIRYQDNMAAILMGLALTVFLCACAAPPESAKPPTAPNSDSSSHSPGLTYRETPVVSMRSAPPSVRLNANPRLGNAQAEIAVIEYSDYECSYCRSFYTRVFPQLKKEYIDTGIVQFIHKDLPLRKIHAHALAAAMAALCAGAQGRFWEMHAALLTTPGPLSPALYLKLAQEFKLDQEKFSACLNDSQYEREILRDIEEARRLGITGTPSFLIGKIQGETLTMLSLAKGAANFAAFAKEIEKLRAPKAGATSEIK